MGLWRGPALADAGEFAAPHAQRLERLRLDALVTRLASEVADDPAGGHVGPLEVLVAQPPARREGHRTADAGAGRDRTAGGGAGRVRGDPRAAGRRARH